MSGPERIWANSQEWPRGTGRIEVYASATPDPDYPSTEYIRADAVAEMIQQAVEAEREACAVVCEEWGAWNDTAQAIAAAIRAIREANKCPPA